jgi:hypothetical protein
MNTGTYIERNKKKSSDRPTRVTTAFRVPVHGNTHHGSFLMNQDSLDFLFEAAYCSPHQTLSGNSFRHLTSQNFSLEPQSARVGTREKKQNQSKKKKKKNVRISPIPSRSSPEEVAFQLSGKESTGRSFKQFSDTIEKLTKNEHKKQDSSMSSKKSNLREALEFSKQTEPPATLSSSITPVGPVSFSSTTIGFNNNLSNLPEWTCLRDNYIRQLHSLESHESIACQKGFKTEISIPNFISLLLSLRKISCRIVYAFQVSLNSRNIHDTSFSDLHGYVLRMVNDMSCINRSPFIDWLGLLTIYNPFLSCRKLDGSSSLLCLERKPSIGVQVHRLSQWETSDEEMKVALSVEAVEVREELRMTETEQEFIDSLSETVWTIFLQHQEATKYRQPQQGNVISNTETADRGAEIADVAFQNVLLKSEQLPSQVRMKSIFWGQWRRRYLIRVGLRNIREGRERCMLRKV